MCVQSFCKTGLSRKITALLFLLFLITPPVMMSYTFIRVSLRLYFGSYEGITFSDVISSLHRGDLKLKTVNEKNPDFDNDFRLLTFGMGGWKYAFIEYYGLVQKTAGKSYIPGADCHGDIYRLDNGYLTTLLPEQKNTSVLAENLVGLGRLLREEHRCELLYVQVPFKICKLEPKLPAGCPADYTNINSDCFLDEIRKSGIAAVDLREVLHGAGLDHDSLFFRTDHHWKPEAGFWAFQVLAEELRKNYGFSIDPVVTDPSQYDRRTYRDLFLGTWGRRTGITYGGLDDFTAVKPAFETDFTAVSANSFNDTAGNTRAGTFEDVFLNHDALKPRYYGKTPYVSYYAYGIADVAYARIRNNISGNSRKILLFHDSFAHVFIPFLAMACEELHVIDLRCVRTEERKLLMDRIEEIGPDLVLFLYSPLAYSPFSLNGEPHNDTAFFGFR